MKAVILTFLFLLCSLVSKLEAGQRVWSDTYDAVVETNYGFIGGITATTTNGKTVYAFKNIPFAKPPVRFSAPKALTGEDIWQGIRDGTKNPPSCAQHLTHLAPASEDCLYLNVYTPIKPLSSPEKLPVMVYIYGGLNIFGDSVIYGPQRLMDHGQIVLIVIHYRVGALGFLSTGDHVVPGNNGLKDQLQALRWVRENIHSFNGDKERVTLFGESAGASATLSHLLSPKSAGLFHKVIAQSGTPLAAWARDYNPVESSQRFAVSVGCTNWADSFEMVQCMRTLPWQTLAQASLSNFYSDASQIKLNFGTIALVVEHNHDDAFITEDPLDILKNGEFPKIPVILGTNQHEGSAVLGGVYSRNLSIEGALENPNYVRHELVPTLLDAVALGDHHIGSPLSQSLVDYYFPADASNSNFTEISSGLVDMLSVLLFKGPILLTADYLSQYSDQVYLYSFEYEGYNSLWTLLVDLMSVVTGAAKPPFEHGVMHADDLIYFWTLPFVLTGKDRQFSEMVCTMWTNFAVESNPTPGHIWANWSNYKTETPYYYKLDLEPEILLDYVTNWRKGFD